MSPLRLSLRVLPLASAGFAALAAAPGVAANAPAATLQSCAAISAPAERLACYDRLSGQAAAAPGAPAAAIPPASASTPPTSPASPPSIAQPATTPQPAGTTQPAATTSSPAAQPPPKDSFGLYRAEHPVVEVTKLPAITTAVIAVGVAPNGHSIVTLDGGQLWELDEADPLLATGDSVTIKRAALGSFLMTTGSGRIHRVRRLR